MNTLNKVAKFINYDVPFTKRMMKPEHKMMKGKYKYEDVNKERTRDFLTQFYDRPNRELYQLLNDTGHEFTKFSDKVF